MKHTDKDMDDLFRGQTLTGSGTPGWDSPSDAVWENVAAHLRERRRRRFVWWIIPGLIASGFIVWMLISREGPAPSADLPLTYEAPIGNSIHEEGQGSSPNQDNISSGVDEPANSSSSHNITGHREPNNSLVKSGSIEADRPSEYQILDGQHTAQATAYNVEKKNPENTIPPSSYEHFPSSDRLDSNGSEPLQQINSEMAALPGSREIDLILPLSSKTPELELIRTFEDTSPPAIQPAVVRCGPGGTNTWSLNLFTAPSWGTRRIIVPRRVPDIRRQYLLNHESPRVQLGFGAGVSYALNSRWEFSSGLEYSKFGIVTHATHQVRFSRADERLNDRGNLENLLDLNLGTSLGEVDAQVIIERSASTQIDEHTFIGLDLEADQRMDVLQIPISLHYHIPLRQWSLGVTGGVSANLIMNNTVSFQTVRSLDNSILNVRVSDSKDIRGTRKVSAGYHLGMEVSRSIGCHWAVFAQPTYSGSFQSVYANDVVGVFPQLFDVHLGLKYYLK